MTVPSEEITSAEPARTEVRMAPVRPARDEAFAALAFELMARLPFAVVVPGKPVESLTDWIDESAIVASIDEKSGFEQAFGIAHTGTPVAAVFKGGGISHAWDSISNAVVHGTVAGEALVLVAADDPEASASTVAVDSRALASTMDVPVVEPCTLSHIPRAVALAAALSRATSEPVMLRYTPLLARLPSELRLVEGQGAAGLDADAAMPRAAAPTRSDGIRRAHAMTKAGRHVHRELVSQPLVAKLVDEAGVTVEHAGTGRTALVGFGPIWSVVGREVADHFGWPTIGSSVTAPVPTEVIEFAARHDTVVTLEEGGPVAEAALGLALRDRGARTDVLGRRTGLVTVARPTAEQVIRAVTGPAGPDRPRIWKDQRGKAAAPPYDRLFEAVARLRARHDLTVATCVGTVIDVAGPPWNSADLALSLGAATGTAAGVAHAGGRAVALTGDFGLLHSGLNAYEVIQRKALAVLTVVVANGVSMRTGGQRTPTHPQEPGALDLVAELRVRGASEPLLLDADEVGTDDLLACLELALDALPATVVLFSGEGAAATAKTAEG